MRATIRSGWVVRSGCTLPGCRKLPQEEVGAAGRRSLDFNSGETPESRSVRAGVRGRGPHKVLAVREKYLPRPRGFGVSLTPFLRGHGNGGEGHRSATRLAYRKRTRLQAPKAQDEAAPNTHTDSGGPASQSRAAVPGNKPRPVLILVRSRTCGHSRIGGLISPKGESRSARLTGGAGRQAISSCSEPRSGGGRVDLGWRLGAKPVLPETASRRSRFVPRPAGGPRPVISPQFGSRARPASHQSVRLAWLVTPAWCSGERGAEAP